MRVEQDDLPITAAVAAKSCEIFQLFLDLGWDINRPVDEDEPPALAYVSINQPNEHTL